MRGGKKGEFIFGTRYYVRFGRPEYVYGDNQQPPLCFVQPLCDMVKKTLMWVGWLFTLCTYIQIRGEEMARAIKRGERNEIQNGGREIIRNLYGRNFASYFITIEANDSATWE